MDREEKRGEERQTGDWPVFKLAPSKQTPVFWGVSGRPDKRETGNSTETLQPMASENLLFETSEMVQVPGQTSR